MRRRCSEKFSTCEVRTYSIKGIAGYWSARSRLFFASFHRNFFVPGNAARSCLVSKNVDKTFFLALNGSYLWTEFYVGRDLLAGL
jgi:hypothetical protein